MKISRSNKNETTDLSLITSQLQPNENEIMHSDPSITWERVTVPRIQIILVDNIYTF